MELDGKVALITGGASGIGLATARLFAREGARLALLDRSESSLAEARTELEARGTEVLTLPADVTSAAEVERAVGEVDRRWGRLDVLFVNAGINGVWAPIDELTPEEWRETMSINLDGTYHTLHYAVPLLKRQGGSIVLTSSINGTTRFGEPGATAYAATKAAQLTLGKMLAIELAKHRIRVNVVCPGWISTGIEANTERRHPEEAGEPVEYPAGSIPLTGDTPGRPEQVAEAVLFLASPRASHITGTPLWVDGAESILQG